MNEIPILNTDQELAKSEILAAHAPNIFHLLTGFAGSGKTTLVQHLAAHWVSTGLDVVLSAPTHKAVAVLARKIKPLGLSVPCQTIHSLLSLAPKPHGDRLIFERKTRAPPVLADIVVIDECSMIDLELLKHIRRHLTRSFVLFVGDPAQLPPVNETESQTFGTKSRSHLATIVRQVEGNPILSAAGIIRRSQGNGMDWSWCKSAKAAPLGIYLPQHPDGWLEKAFTSTEFTDDADTFRYLCWTNERVAAINRKVRNWIYGGPTPTPYMPGERILIRSPAFAADGQTPLLGTNEEATVLTIAPATLTHTMSAHEFLLAWTAEIPSWHFRLRKDNGEEVEIDAARDDRVLKRVLGKIADEASETHERWGEYHALKQRMVWVQNVYAMTVHASQGSTFRHCFIDVPDIRRRAATNPLECQQLFYVAVTRPTHTVTLIGAVP